MAREQANSDVEYKEYLSDLTINLDDLEKLILNLIGADGKNLNFKPLRWLAHSIKGSAGSFGLDLISTICHRLEDHIAIFEHQEFTMRESLDSLFTFKDDLVKAKNAYTAQDKSTLSALRHRYHVTDQEQNQANESPKQDTVSGEAQSKPLRILVIESSKVLLKMVLKSLTEFEVETATARDGYEALGRLIKEEFDLVITGSQVPAIGAKALVQCLESIGIPNKGLKFIVLSSDEGSRFQSKRFAVHMISKGINLPKELTDLISPWAVKKKSEEEFPVLDFPVGFKILLIDDAPIIHKLLELAFKPYSHIRLEHCMRALDAEGAALLAKPDLILVDVQMPDLNGDLVFQKLRSLKKLPPDLPIAFLTATTDRKEVALLEKLQPFAIIKKPFSPTKLPLILNEIFYPDKLVKKGA